MSNQKKVSVIVAVIICVALLLGGTLAWTDFTQNRVNKFKGTTDPDVTLHDDFDGRDKDVYVENTGTQDIYVRVRLDEYMEVGGVSFVETANVRDKDTWMTHTFDNLLSYEDCGHPGGEHLFHKYYKWTMSGAEKGYTPGTPGLVSSKLDEDGKVTLTGPNQTLPANAPITMNQYIMIAGKSIDEMTEEEKVLWNRVDTGCWILDVDGWAYWSKVLKPDTATNLLLDEVELIREPNEDWFYGINVKLQAVTSNDFEKWSTNGYTKTLAADVLIGNWEQELFE